MELFGTKFTIALGAWRLRFVLMLEDDDDRVPVAAARAVHPHHVTVLQNKRAGV
jgi:hypothetical protein